jgi:AcrR family transcriptional regulator
MDRLLDAFGELVLEHGYAEVSLADVASRAGLARTAIYNYFPDRESLLFAWADREVARTIAILEAEVAQAETHEEKLRIFVRQQLLDFAARHLPPGQEVMQFLKPETYGRFMRHIEPVERIARSIVLDGAKAGEFATPGDPADTVPMILACIGAERGPVATRAHDVEEATERVTTFLLRALGAVEPTGKTAGSKKAAPKKRARA